MNKAKSINEIIEKHKNDPELRFIWGGIPLQSKGLIAGVAKTGKTTFAENLAICIAIGRKEFFGESLIGEPKKVLFINLEESTRIRNIRVKKQMKELTDEEIVLMKDNYLTNDEGFPEFMINVTDWEKLKELIDTSDAEVVIIDSLSHLLSGKIESSKDVMNFIKFFREYVMSSDKTVMVVHHNVKSNNKPMDQENIAGSRIVAQEFEYAIGFSNIPNRTGGKYCTMVYNKFVATDSNLVKIYDINENNWLNIDCSENVHNLYKEDFRDARFSDVKEKLLLGFFSKSSQAGSQVTTKELMETFVEDEPKIMSKQTLHKWLHTLIDEGLIKRCDKGVYELVNNGNDEKE